MKFLTYQICSVILLTDYSIESWIKENKYLNRH